MSQDQDFVNYVCAANPLLLVKTYEEYRVLSKYVAALSKMKVLDKNGQPTGSYNTHVWSLHGGVRQVTLDNKVLKTATTAVEGTEKNPMAALDFLVSAPDNTVLFVKDFHPYLTKEYGQSISIIEKIRDLVRPCNATGKALVFISPHMQIPSELEKDITPIDFKLPDKAELQLVLKGVCQSTGAVMPSAKDTDILLDACLGMTAQEAENALSLSLVEAKKFDPALIRREKAVIVKKGGLLEVIETTESLDTIGGLEIAKDWANNQKDCFTPEAKAFGVKPPKGILLLGLAGCGKSLLSKALATSFGRPLLRLDMSNIMDKWVGGSESKMKACLETAEAVSPCILWMDEIEKGLAGNSGGAGQEGHEVTRRIFGMLLTWIEEKKKDVILVATANSISNLPPELISRFSTSFWVDLPDRVQRPEIVKIHLKKVGRPADLFTEEQLEEITRLTENFNGREIEAAVKDSVARAWSKRHPQIQIDDLVDAVKAVAPIAVVKKAEFEALRTQARNMGTKPASISHEAATSTNKSRKINTTGVAG
jgi:ATP-dependent 26S proteasome regulatory subunit